MIGVINYKGGRAGPSGAFPPHSQRMNSITTMKRDSVIIGQRLLTFSRTTPVGTWHTRSDAMPRRPTRPSASPPGLSR
eukprot:6228739-Prymnesium_polylepis.1